MTSELLVTNEWAPKTSIRTHRFIQDKPVRFALTNYPFYARKIAEWDVKRVHQKRKYNGDMYGYLTDLVGPNHQEMRKVMGMLTEYYKVLGSMSDNDLVELNEERDGVCKSCPIMGGKHCVRFNYQSEQSETIEGVTSAIDLGQNKLFQLFENRGYKNGEDYIAKTNEVTLLDMQGLPLNTLEEGIPHTIPYQSIIAKVGMLRDIIRTEDKAQNVIYPFK